MKDDDGDDDDDADEKTMAHYTSWFIVNDSIKPKSQWINS